MNIVSLHIRRHNARVPIIVIPVVLLGVTALVVATGAIAIYVLSRDEPPPNVTDLKFVRLELRDDDNAFSYFEKAAADMYWPKEREEDEDRFWRMHLGRPEWDEKLVGEFLKANERMFEHLDRGLSVGTCQVPEVRDNFQKLDYLGKWRDMAMLARLRALHDFKEGREQRAFERAVDIVKFGPMIDDSGGTLIYWLTGNAVQWTGLGLIRELLAETTLPPDQLRPFIERLGAYETNGEALCNAYRAEYQFFLCIVDDVAAGNGPRYDIPRIRNAHGFLFKANQTRMMCADYIRWGVRNATRPRSEWEPATPGDVEWLLAKGGRPSVLTGNGVGKILLAMAAPDLDGINMMACRTNWSLKATTILVALRCYMSKRGDLPDGLEALVPEYLKEVPADPFDDKPLRYSRDKRLIYAIDEEFRERDGSIEVTFRTQEKEKEGPNQRVEVTR